MGGKRVQPKPKKKRMRKRTKFTILSIFNLTWYAVVVLILNACGHTVDTELTVAGLRLGLPNLPFCTVSRSSQKKPQTRTLRGEKMQVLKEITLDKVINLYEGQVVHDKKQLIEWDDHRRTPLYELKERTLAQDKMILGALKCARANGYSGEE